MASEIPANQIWFNLNKAVLDYVDSKKAVQKEVAEMATLGDLALLSRASALLTCGFLLANLPPPEKFELLDTRKGETSNRQGGL